MKKKILTFLTIIYFLILLSFVINAILNQGVYIKGYSLEYENLPEDFNNYKIVQLTDIHSIRSEKQIDQIVEKVRKQNPDVICVTGDLIDSSYYAEQLSYKAQNKISTVERYTIKFMEELTKIAKIYYVYGNHEMMLLDDPENNEFKVALENIGVEILNNKLDYLYKGNSKIRLLGIQDPACLYKDEKYSEYKGESSDEKARIILSDLYEQDSSDEFTILLAHRPECFEVYASFNIDLSLTGHTHGGMIRLPFIRGIYAHPQGFFPKYSYGLYENRNSKMIVGGGIGYSGNIHFRLYNLPEIEVINLVKK